MPRAPEEFVQLRALTAAFFARFFESDTTAERTDATRSFFWLLAILAAPGLLLTTYRQFLWERIARRGEGLAALHQAVRADTAEYLALTFVAVAVVAAARWQSLVIDRRDALVLGTLPARPRTIVSAKLAALAGYTGLLAAGMHLGTALVQGIALGGLERPTNVAGTMAGLAIAAVGLTVFVITAVASIQAAGLALVGPRRFTRVSVTMQMALVASVLVVFVLMPGHSARAFSTFDADGVGGPAWVFWLPPLWFLGVYETIAGSASAELRDLARIGWSALALALGLLLVTGPIAGARTLRAAFAVSALARWPIGRWLADRLARALTRQPAARGAIAFTFATLGRVSAPRLVFALLCAAGLTGLVPVLAATILLRPEATTAVLAFPFVMQFFALLGLRLAIRTPVELPGRWLFDQTDVSPLAGRAAAWRILFVGGVVVPILATAVLWLWLWEPVVAVARIVAALAGGWLALEVLMWGYVGVPCSRPLVSAAFRGRTLALAAGFEIFCFESAAAQAGWRNEIGPVLWQAMFFAVAATGVHIGSERAAAVNAIVDEHLDPRLDLEVVGPLEHGFDGYVSTTGPRNELTFAIFLDPDCERAKASEPRRSLREGGRGALGSPLVSASGGRAPRRGSGRPERSRKDGGEAPRELMLEVRNVSKRYGALTAVRHVSFIVKPGEVLGYLGPNGSGKSTTVKMLVGLMPPTSGTILFDGEDVQDRLLEYKAQVGYVPEEAHVYTYLTGPEYLRLTGRLRGMSERTIEEKIDRFLKLFGLDTDYHAPLSAFSKGMRQKILLSAALMHNPRVIVLDEPVSGLDVSTALVLRTGVRSLANDGRIIFYSSHELDTIEKISTRVMILHEGTVVADDSPARLRELANVPSLEDVFAKLAVRQDLDAMAGALIETVRL